MANASSRALAHTLSFHATAFNVVDHQGQRWLRASEIGAALGYADDKAVQRIYARHSEEFTTSMTGVVNLTTPSGKQDARVFSLRGAHLIAMFARTDVAKEFRRWVLDILDKEAANPVIRHEELVTVNDWVTQMTRQLNERNSFPAMLFEPLVDAVNRKLGRNQDSRTQQALDMLAEQLSAQAKVVALLAGAQDGRGASLPYAGRPLIN